MVSAEDRWQHTLFNLNTGEFYIRYVKGLIEKPQASHERDIMWAMPPRYSKEESYMTVELSLPKLYYGHNISLLYDWPKALELLRSRLKEFFGWRQLAKIETWKLNRVDFCYAWRMPSEETARAFLELMKRLRYPHKKPQHRENSAFWPGATYSAKVYGKASEFKANDYSKLCKAKANPEWIEHLEEKAKGVVRFEITGKPKLLRNLGIVTVADLMGHVLTFEVSPDLLAWAKTVKNGRGGPLDSIADTPKVIEHVLMIAALEGHLELNEKLEFSFANGQILSFPEMISPPMNDQGDRSRIPGGEVRVSWQLKTEHVLQTYLGKLVGNGDMSMADQALEKLQAAYKSNKAAKLMGIWVLISRFTVSEVKEMLGKSAYYRAVADLKAAGVPLMEQAGVLIKPEESFFNNFRMEVPSEHVVNHCDDFRDGDNLLNLAEWKKKNSKAG